MSIVGIVTAVGAVATVVGVGASMYGKYKEGSAMENTDWSGMIGDVDQIFEDNLSNLRDKASNAFAEVEQGWKSGASALGDKATSMWDQASNKTTGLTTSGMETYTMEQTVEDINRDAETMSKNRELREEGLQTEFEGQELDLATAYEEERAELTGGEDASKGWYPGKYIGKALRDSRLKENISLIGKSPSWINIYEFNFIGNPTRYRGVMADEVGYASWIGKDGYRMVDYSQLDVEFEEV